MDPATEAFLTPELKMQLGFSLVFLLILYWAVRILIKYIEEKDKRIKELTDNLAEKYEENTRAMVSSQSSIDNNTDVMKTVVAGFNELMRSVGKKDS